MRSTAGLNCVSITIQGLFLTVCFLPKTKSSRNELEPFYRGDGECLHVHASQAWFRVDDYLIACDVIIC